MCDLFSLDKFDNFSENINIDDLYEKKRQKDLKKLELFQKMLNRIHKQIKITSRQKNNTNSCWFMFPEIIIGYPIFDIGGCIAYVIDKLKSNQFVVKYYSPNTIFISWNHWIPTYIRTELKHKTGIIVNEFGNCIEDEKEDVAVLQDETSNNITNKSNKDKKYTPISTYKPSGIIYKDEHLNKMKEKILS